MQLIAPEQATLSSCGAAAQRAVAFAAHGAPTIGNVQTQMQLLKTDQHLFPVSINHGDESAANCYVVSPLTTYTHYAQYEIRQLHRPWLTWPLMLLSQALGRWLQSAQIDRLVQVNNWLLSTNLYPPDWHGHDVPAITRLLCHAFPDHAIGFRSLNRISNPDVLAQLESLGYVAVPSRQVYLFDARMGTDAPFLQRSDVQKDARLLAKTPYTRVPGHLLQEADYQRLTQLYRLLYLEKYSALNPHYSAQWLQAGQRDGWLELLALRSPEGRLDGVVGWFAAGNTLSSPMVGYDTALPQRLGLYRMLAQLSLERAVQRKMLLNLSAGAASFKRQRGGTPAIEYTMVYIQHLPLYRQRPWRMLSRVLQSIGVPFMQRMKL
ncbi:MAG: GNAT family N-acetyltransferase [Pseudomonadota bacterium]|nr:GNAT family N-acetyltransferase [Pseudomonadota bacterium]